MACGDRGGGPGGIRREGSAVVGLGGTGNREVHHMQLIFAGKDILFFPIH